MRINKAVFALFITMLAGCGGPAGSDFEGKWSENSKKDPSSLIVKKDGKIYHIDYTNYNPWLKEYGTKKLEASAVSDNVLTIVGSMGVANLRLENGQISFDNKEYLKIN